MKCNSSGNTIGLELGSSYTFGSIIQNKREVDECISNGLKAAYTKCIYAYGVLCNSCMGPKGELFDYSKANNDIFIIDMVLECAFLR